MENCYCYNCGALLDNSNKKTKEHIPARAIYQDFPEEYKKNRIVVPACLNCNSLYSKIDQELRDAIGVTNSGNPLQKTIVEKTVRSITRMPDWERRVELENGHIKSVLFKYKDLQKLHIKNFKGLFYYKFGKSLPDNFKIEIFAEGDEQDVKLLGSAKYLFSFITKDKQWECSGHEKVFKFILKAFKKDTENDNIIETSNFNECDGIACILVYHDQLSPIVVALRTPYLKEIEHERRANRQMFNSRPSQNGPCPCGSGKKFKRCCGKK